MPPSSPRRIVDSDPLPSSLPSAPRIEVSRDARETPTSSRKAKRGFDSAEKIAKNANEPFLSGDVEGVSAKQKVSSWTLSFVLHGAIFLFLAFLFLPNGGESPELEAIFSADIGDQLDFLTEDEGSLNPNQAEEYKLTVPEEITVDDLAVFEEKILPFDPQVNAPVFEQTRVEISEALAGRTDPGVKNDLLAKYGGTKTTEAAVEAGLQWLRKQQLKDGSWSLCGPYSDGTQILDIDKKPIDNKPAATALALLAFQGAGNTRSSGEYSSVVRRGWVWLLRQQNEDGCFTPRKRSYNALFYTHAICTIALCELITLEKKANPELRRAAKKAIDYLLENQNSEMGGWKYEPQVGSDLSVTGWCLMALRSSEMAGFKTPQSYYDRISSFLDSISFDDGADYVYELNAKGEIQDGNKRPSMTATGLLCREYLGWTPSENALLRGAEKLATNDNLIHFPTTKEEEKTFFHNVYGWYSTSMALKGLGPYNKYWRKWNGALSKELPARQEPKGSPEAGSWNPRFDEYNFGGGRLYVTTLSILCLEVYYRYLPLYQ